MDQGARTARLRTVNPDLAILPVFRFNTAEGRIIESLGTAFFFSIRPTILSVKHVLGVQPGPDEAIVVPRQRPPHAESGRSSPTRRPPQSRTSGRTRGRTSRSPTFLG